MSCYYCAICDELKDRDIHGCNAHPSDPYENICDDCDCELQDEACIIEENHDEWNRAFMNRGYK